MRYVLANWKMYPTVDEACATVTAVQAGLRKRVEAGRSVPRVIVCPPFVALAPLRELADGDLVRLGAQTCHWEQEGPYTGEISPRMLEGLVDYVMVGHSERRAAGETDDQMARKVAAVGERGLVPILFAGEDEPEDDALAVTEERLRRRLPGGTTDVVVVYEPAWAIGADAAAPAAHVGRVVTRLKEVLQDLEVAAPTVLYGGTVNDENIEELAALDVLDGVGATRSSLRPEGLLRIVDAVGGAPGDGR